MGHIVTTVIMHHLTLLLSSLIPLALSQPQSHDAIPLNEFA